MEVLLKTDWALLVFLLLCFVAGAVVFLLVVRRNRSWKRMFWFSFMSGFLVFMGVFITGANVYVLGESVVVGISIWRVFGLLALMFVGALLFIWVVFGGMIRGFGLDQELLGRKEKMSDLFMRRFMFRRLPCLRCGEVLAVDRLLPFAGRQVPGRWWRSYAYRYTECRGCGVRLCLKVRWFVGLYFVGVVYLAFYYDLPWYGTFILVLFFVVFRYGVRLHIEEEVNSSL